MIVGLSPKVLPGMYAVLSSIYTKIIFKYCILLVFYLVGNYNIEKIISCRTTNDS